MTKNLFSPQKNTSKIRSTIKNTFNKSIFKGCCNKLSDFVYNNSKETALVMLVFNSVSVLSGHLSQISGLKNSKRENKDYLITQEKKEMGLDIFLTVIPPFIINNLLMKQLDSGRITTKSAREKLTNIVAPVAGPSKGDLYSTEHIIPIKKQLLSLVQKVAKSMQKTDKISVGIRNKLFRIEKFAESRLPVPNSKVPGVSLEKIVTDFDNKRLQQPKNIIDKLYHGSAVDDLLAQRNGFLIMATLGYTILASNVIMPILKNKLTNREYEKKLKAGLELSPETIERRKRFGYQNTKSETPGLPVFNDFYYNYDGDLHFQAEKITKFDDKIKGIKEERLNNTFSSFKSLPCDSQPLKI